MSWIDYRKTHDMVLQSLKLYKVLSELKIFIEKTMQNLKVELAPGGRSLVEVKIRRGIFQGDALSPLLFVIAMIPLNHILRKCTSGYKLTKLQEKINYLMFAKDEKQLKTLIQTVKIYTQDIGMEFGIENVPL